MLILRGGTNNRPSGKKKNRKTILRKKIHSCGNKVTIYVKLQQQKESPQSLPWKVIELGQDYESSWCRAVQSCLFYIIYQHQIIFHN